MNYFQLHVEAVGPNLPEAWIWRQGWWWTFGYPLEKENCKFTQEFKKRDKYHSYSKIIAYTEALNKWNFIYISLTECLILLFLMECL